MSEIITIGQATLYHGDCRDILPSLPKVDLVLTDPPYGIGESGRKNASRVKPFGSRVDAKNTKGTFVKPVDYGDFDWDQTPPSDSLIHMAVASGAAAIIFGGNFFPMPPSPKWLVWDKLNSGDFADCEIAWTNLPGAVRIFRHMWNGMLRDSERGIQRQHPTQKPIVLMEWCINLAPKTTSTVADPFAGSGTTGVACVRMGKKFYGIERERKYFDIMCERIQREVDKPQLFPFSCDTAGTSKQDYQYGLQQQLIQTCEKE